MGRFDGEKLGRWSLRLDAAYCLLLGVAVAVFAGQIAERMDLSQVLIVATGIAVVVWAGGILLMMARLPLRVALRLVMIANLLAAVVVAFASTTAATVLVASAVVLVAAEVALFAASQVVALRALSARG